MKCIVFQLFCNLFHLAAVFGLILVKNWLIVNKTFCFRGKKNLTVSCTIFQESIQLQPGGNYISCVTYVFPESLCHALKDECQYSSLLRRGAPAAQRVPLGKFESTLVKDGTFKRTYITASANRTCFFFFFFDALIQLISVDLKISLAVLCTGTRPLNICILDLPTVVCRLLGDNRPLGHHCRSHSRGWGQPRGRFQQWTVSRFLVFAILEDAHWSAERLISSVRNAFRAT